MLEFWKKEDLLLIKKIEHFAKSIWTKKRIYAYISFNNYLQEEWNKLKDKISSLEEYYTAQNLAQDIQQKIRQAMLRKDVKSCIDSFITKNIIPKLVEEWFFEKYVVPVKTDKETKKKIFAYYQS